MIRRTLGSVKNDISKISSRGVCGNDELRNLVNEAQEWLLNKGKYAGTVVRVNFCAYSGCITLPRELASIESIAICGMPRRIENPWYEFLDGGPWIQKGGCGDSSAVIDSDNSVTFKDICGPKRLRVYTDLTEATGSQILVRGIDENGNRVQTFVDNEWIDGEYISLVGGPVLSAKLYTKIDSVVKPITKGYVRVYQYDDDTAVQSCIAIYAPTETLPTYRRYRVPSISCDASEHPKCVTALAKRQFLPVFEDNDELFITNLRALKFAVQAIEAYDTSNVALGDAFELKAVRALNEELKEYRGGAQGNINVQMRGFSMGSIPRVL